MAKDSGITKWYGKEVFTEATEANVKAMHKAALIVEADVKKNFTLQGGGRSYKRGKVSHRASIEGQPPAIDTGILRSSIMSDVKVKSDNVIGRVGPDVEMIAAKADVGTDINYGLYLEVGTRTIGRRPFLVPALFRTKSQIERIFKQANK